MMETVQPETTKSASKRKETAGKESSSKVANTGKSSKSDAGGASAEFETNPDFLVKLCYTPSSVLSYVTLANNEIFFAERDEKAFVVFKHLLRHGFQSAPVLSKIKKLYFGQIDMMDFVTSIVEHFGLEKLTSLKEGEFWSLVEEEKNFQEKTVNDVIKAPLSKKNPYHPLNNRYSSFAAIEALVVEPVLHRVPLIDDNYKLTGLITQSQVLQFLVEHMGLIGDKRAKPISAIPGVLHDVVSVSSDVIVWNAFKMMIDNKISGVGVIDKEGKLIGNLSLRDIRAICSDGRLFWRLGHRAEEYIFHLRAEQERLYGLKLSSPIVVHPESDLQTTMTVLHQNRIHHVFVTNKDSGKCVGIISLKDVLAEMLRPETHDQQFQWRPQPGLGKTAA